MFRFPNHNLKLKARDQPNQLTNQIKQRRKQVLSRDSKELFEQHFVKVFDQNRKHVEAQN